MEPLHREDPDAAGQQVVSRATSVDSRHNAYAACLAITLNLDCYSERWVTLWPLTGLKLMGQTVVSLNTLAGASRSKSHPLKEVVMRLYCPFIGSDTSVFRETSE